MPSSVATQVDWLPPLHISNWLSKITTQFGAMAALGGLRHYAIDISASVGTPIYAPKDGRVTRTYSEAAGGNVLVIDHGGGIEEVFAHLSRYNVREGQSFKQGDVIGFTGATGNVTGPHLHWEVKRNGNPINPVELFDPLAAIPDSAYKAAKAGLNELRDALQKIVDDIPGSSILDEQQGTIAIPESYSGCPPGTEPTVLPSLGNPEGTHVCFIRQGPFGVKIEPLDALADFTGSVGEFLFGGGLVQFLINLLVLLAGTGLVLIGGRMIWQSV